MKYPTGALPSFNGAPCKSDFHASDVYAGASPVKVRDYDFRDVHDWRIQGAPSCVLYSLVAQISIMAAKQGSRLERLSAELAWWQTRNYIMPPGTAITGTSRRIAMKVVRDRGLKPEYVYQDTARNHSVVPPGDVLQEPPIVKLTQYHRINGEQNVSKLRDGILNAFALCENGGQCSPPNVIMDVGKELAETPNEGIWNGELTELWGGHDMCAVAYRAKDDMLGLASTWLDKTITYVPLSVLADKAREFTVVTEIARLET